MSLGLLVITIGLSSCISNKRIVYLQDKTQKYPFDHLADVKYEAQDSPYKLEPNDVISVKINHLQLSRSVSETEELNEAIRSNQIHPFLNGFTIDAAGNVDLPVVGKVQIMGMTLFEAQEAISQKASEFYANPSVRLFLMNYYVTILGEVNNPGRYAIYNNRITFFEAMGMAGDATDFASREEIKVLRIRDGQNHLFHIDLTDEKILDSEMAFVQPNDVIMVKPQKRKKYATRDVQNLYNGLATLISAISLIVVISR